MAAPAVGLRAEVTTETPPSIEGLRIKNILCPVDFSDFSRRALRHAIGLARHFSSGLIVQHTVQPNYFGMAGIESGAVLIDMQGQIQSAREQIRGMLLATGIDTSEATVILNNGDASSHILGTILRERIDLVVMGTHGHRGFNRALLGSVTEDIIHSATCPVLVVSKARQNFVDPEQGEHLGTILVATDFSSHSDRALAYALKWGCEWNTKVILFHSVQQVDPAMKGFVDLFPEYNLYFERQIAEAWEMSRQWPAARGSCHVLYEVRQGNPKEEILRVAEERNVDLIITGARGASSSSEPWGSVSSAVVRDGRFPTMVVRELPA